MTIEEILARPDYVGGEGAGSTKLLIVGEAPGEKEALAKRPFVGPSGAILNELLRNSGVSRDEVYITNVVKVRPPENKLYRLKELNLSIPDFLPILWNEIDTIDPNCILALGGTALRSLTGKLKIGDYRGSILQSVKGYPKVVPTIHPAALFEKGDKQEGMLSSPWRQKVLMQFDFNRAVQQSGFKDFKLPQRTLHVAKNYYQVYQFFQRYQSHDFCILDVETSKCIPKCLGVAFNKVEAISIPLLDLRTSENDTGFTMTDLVATWQLIAKFLRDPKIRKGGQNIKFDVDRLRTIGLIVEPITSDMMLTFHNLYPEMPKKLQVISSIYTEEPYYKDEGKEFDPKKDDPNQLYLYNAKDAVVEFECDEVLKADIKELHLEDVEKFTMELFHLYREMESNGIKVDFDQRKKLIGKYGRESELNGKQIEDLLGHPVNVNSPKQMAKVLYDELGLPLRWHKNPKGERVPSTDEETLIALKVNAARKDIQKDFIDLGLKGRKIHKTIGTYLLAEVDPDGRMRTQFRLHGTDTYRTSTSILKPPVRVGEWGVAFQTLTKHGNTGEDLRSIYIPDSGYCLIEPDLSQAESRVVALLSRDELALEAFRKGEDIHKLTASWVFDLLPSQINKEQRDLGKTVRHAGERGMGKNRLSQMAGISAWKADKILTKFHEHSPNLRAVYFQEIQDTLQNDNMILRTPHGRYRQFFDRWDEELFKKAYSFIPQAVVSDHLKLAMLRLRARLPYIMFLVECHDSFLAQIPLDKIVETCQAINEELTRPIDFSRCSLSRGELVIPNEIKIGFHNWQSMEKIK